MLHGSSSTWFQTSRYCHAKVEFNSINLIRHGSSTTWFQTSRYCHAKVEFNSINLIRHGSSTTFETGVNESFQSFICF